MLMVAFVLPQALDREVSEDAAMIFGLPVLAFIFPLVGLFIAPIYPLLNSVVLSALPKKMHSPMTGLIVLFSATGGTLVHESRPTSLSDWAAVRSISH